MTLEPARLCQGLTTPVDRSSELCVRVLGEEVQMAKENENKAFVPEIGGGEAVEKGVNQLREGYKPAKPPELSQPKPVPVPPPPGKLEKK